MARENKYLNVNPDQLTKEELQRAVESMAKTANQRLAELERSRNENGKYAQYSEHSSAYAYVKKIAFDKGKLKEADRAKRAFIEGRGEDAPRFSRKVAKMTEETLREEVESLQKFLKASTSTVSGTKKVLTETYKAFTTSEKGTDVSRETYKGFWEDALIKHAMSLFYSSINELMTIADKKKLSAGEVKKILEDIGVTEDIKDETDLGKLNRGKEGDDIISIENIKKRMLEWKKNGTSSTDGQSIRNPEDEDEED